MNKLKSLALAALATFGLSAYGGVTTNAWWNVTFETDSFQTGFEGLTIGELGPLTNDESTAQCVQPYAEGVWAMIDGDESYVTNGLATNWVSGALAEVAVTTYLKLDTQGNDLTWTPTDTTNNVKNIVDADLFLVGSESEPAVDDFDGGHDVQTAIYLKNEQDPDSGETTNSILCVYVYQGGSNTWQELEGVELADNAWAHVQVMVDHSGANPMVSVAVNGTTMHARGDAATTEWRAANYSRIGSAVSSVAFRGTGAVDNFVGTTVAESSSFYTFTAQAYLDNTLRAVDAALNPTVENTDEEVKSGSTTKFEGFKIDDVSTGEATYALTQIVIYAPDGTVRATFNYTYTDAATAGTTSGQVAAVPDDSAYVEFDPDFFDDTKQDGPFAITVPTDTATSNAVLVKVYFVSFNPPSPAEPDPVDPGESLSAADLAGGIVPAGIVTENPGTPQEAEYFVVNFRAPEAGVTYTLMSTTDLTLTEDQWKGIAQTGNATEATGDGTATSTAPDQLITLKVPMTGNVKFFKIKASK